MSPERRHRSRLFLCLARWLRTDMDASMRKGGNSSEFLHEAQKMVQRLTQENEALRTVLARLQGENAQLAESLLRATAPTRAAGGEAKGELGPNENETEARSEIRSPQQTTG